ncbi:MAG: hypothetical protein ACI8YQ_001207 [Polaribacter sp.]|jgi:hypothetical protein
MAGTKLNNFQELEELQINEHLEQRPDVSPKIEMGVMANMRTISFMGDILELYLPRVAEIIVTIFGGRRDATISQDGQGGFTEGDQKPD